MKNTLFEHVGGNQFRLVESKELPFPSKIAKSMYEYHIQTKGITSPGKQGSFTFYRKATDKQSPYVVGKYGDFIGNDGRYVSFSPFGGNSVLFISYPSGTWPEKEAKLK